MNGRITTALVLALVLVPLVPAVQASHFQAYGNHPTEHDDLGSSLEPDFSGVTGILGVPVNERAIDTNLDGFGEPTSTIANRDRLLAPGCTDDQGRQPNGLCGLYNIGINNGAGTESGTGFPPRTLGTPGTTGTGAPGLTLTKGKEVRFLDQKAVADNAVPGLGTMFTDFNWKLRDLGVQGALSGLDGNLGSQFLLNSMAHFAWYGKWADKNGNGVIDHLQAEVDESGPVPQPLPNPANEFQWYGNCFRFNSAEKIVGWHCNDESLSVPQGKAELAAYIYPGNHHAYCGAAIANQLTNLCDKVGVDLPGAAVLCFADVLTASVAPVATTLLGRCFASQVGDIDPNENDFEGDPIFGVQDSIAPDQTFDDRTGDEGIDTRGWYYGLGWPTFYYDQSLITTTTMIAVANCPQDGSARFYNVAQCRFTDVDVYPTWSPVLESLVGGLKPTARSSFTTVRDSVGPFSSGLDGQINNERLDLTGNTGPLEDQLQDPGFAREPNHPGDVLPGAAYNVDGCANGRPLFNGWCNSYAGYQAGRHAWADMQVFRSITYDRAVAVTASGCQLCVAGPGITTTLTPEPIDGGLRGTDDFRRSLGPGAYFLGGAVGSWRDTVQKHEEDYYDLDPLSPTFGTLQNRDYATAPDGWIGNVINATATYYYRGYADESCTTENGPGTYPYAVCHPYLDGAIQNPQQPGATSHGEWGTNQCNDNVAKATLTPAGGVWTVPVIVMRGHTFLKLPAYLASGAIQDLTGTNQPITIKLVCGEFGGFLGNDLLVLPAGNLDLDITTRLTSTVSLIGGTENVVDVDVYEGWGA